MHFRNLIPAPLRSALRPLRRALMPDAPAFVGYLRSRGPDGISGWIHDPADAGRRLAFDAVILRAGQWQVLAEGVADRHDAELAALGIGDACYAFHLPLPPGVQPEEAVDVQIRPKGFHRMLEAPPPSPIGYVRSRSPQVVTGWAFDRGTPGQRLAVEAGIERDGAWQVLATGTASEPDAALVGQGVGDGCHGFRLALPPGLMADEVRRVQVRVAGSPTPLPYVPAIEGFVRTRSTSYVAGWARLPGTTGRESQLVVETTLPGAARVLGRVAADLPDPVMAATGQGDARCGFRLDFHPPLTAAERDSLRVTCADTDHVLPLAPPSVPGYVRTRSTGHVAGWVREPGVEGRDLELVVECTLAGATRELGRITADLHDPTMAAFGQGDAKCGFRLEFDPPLSPAERDSLLVTCLGTGLALPFAPPAAPGYVRERTSRRVAGWMRDPLRPEQRMGYEVICRDPSGERILASGMADRIDERLEAAGAKDPGCGFEVAFEPPLGDAERDTLEVRWTETGGLLPRAGTALLGYVRSCTSGHVEGWMRHAGDPAHRVAFIVRSTLPGHERVLASGVADRHDPALAAAGMADPACGFRVAFPSPLSAAECEHVVVECAETLIAVPRAGAIVLGYVRECTVRHVAGWMRRESDFAERVAYEVRCTLPGAERVLATGVASLEDAALADAGLEEAACGFRVEFAAPLTDIERDHVEVWPQGAAEALPRASSAILGYVRERSTRHVAGWMHSTANPSERIEFDVVVADGARERVIGSGTADQFDRVLFALKLEDPVHGFRLLFDEPVTEAEALLVQVRPRATGRPIPPAPDLLTEWKPVRYIAMDIVDNCNLRCPFCVFDHAPVHKTNVMDDDMFERALRWLPLVGPEGLWMSCLHEPSMHPKLPDMIERIPRHYRHLMHYTTNLTRRMPDRYYEVLANSGLANLNVSIESRDPAVYERMRKGSRFRIFQENWDKLLETFAKGSAPPPLRYISMAYKSNYRELPELIAWLRTEKRAWKVEVRDTYVVPWIPEEFREAEFLDHSEWAWLRDQLAHYDPTEVTLCLPPDFDRQSRPEPFAISATDAALEAPVAAVADAVPAAAPAPAPEPEPMPAPEAQAPAGATVQTSLRAKKAARMPGLLEGRILHDGTLIIIDSLAGNYPHYGKEIARANIRDIDDPEAFIMALFEANA